MATIDYKQKIKDYMNSSEVDTLYKSMLNNLFPELGESEDERIRESLLEYLHTLPNHYSHSGVCAPEWIAWLKRQGENVSLPKFTFDDVLALQCCMETAKKVQEDKELYEQLQSLHDRLYDAYWLEKQEEKPVEEYNIAGIKTKQHTEGKLAEIIKDIESADKIEALRTEYEKGRADAIAEMQKSAWSEDDESILQGIRDEILANKHDAKEYEWKTYDKFLNWLKNTQTKNRRIKLLRILKNT